MRIPFLLLITALSLGWQSMTSAAEPQPPRSNEEKIAARKFPSIFQAWNGAENMKDEDAWTTLARHDLVFHAPDFFGLRWSDEFTGLATEFTPASIKSALQLKQKLQEKNENLILLAEFRYRDAHASYLPPEHTWWRRQNGKRVVGWEEGGYWVLDFANPTYRAQVTRQAKAIMDSGVFAGIMLDWWEDDADRLALVREIRAAIGDQALILVNANDRQTPRTASFVNGYFMECYRSKTTEDWNRIADTLVWAEKNLKQPRINCLEIWFENSRQDLARMRATTTLALTLSDGYCLFSDPNPLPTPDHLHDWYSFWDRRLGRALSVGEKQANGSIQREFERGRVVHNPMGNQAVSIEFSQPHISAANKQAALKFELPGGDGDLYLLDEAK